MNAPRKQTKWLWRVDVGTPEAEVLQYLRGGSHDYFSKRVGTRMALDAILAFWKPLAFQRQKKMSQAELGEMGRYCFDQLIHQAERLARDLKLGVRVVIVNLDMDTPTASPITAPAPQEVRIVVTREDGLGSRQAEVPSSTFQRLSTTPNSSPESFNGRIIEAVAEDHIKDESEMEELDVTTETASAIFGRIF